MKLPKAGILRGTAPLPGGQRQRPGRGGYDSGPRAAAAPRRRSGRERRIDARPLRSRRRCRPVHTRLPGRDAALPAAPPPRSSPTPSLARSKETHHQARVLGNRFAGLGHGWLTSHAPAAKPPPGPPARHSKTTGRLTPQNRQMPSRCSAGWAREPSARPGTRPPRTRHPATRRRDGAVPDRHPGTRQSRTRHPGARQPATRQRLTRPPRARPPGRGHPGRGSA